MPRVTRRTALKAAATGFAAPFVFRRFATAAPSETVLHASFGASGLAGADIGALTARKHKVVVRLVHDGAIGKVKEVHSWSGKSWGDTKPKPDRTDTVPAGFDWDKWLRVAAERPFIGGGYYHPGNWRKRLDFGTGTFGDMGCHIYDPVFEAIALTAPLSVRSEGPVPTADSWANDAVVHYTFPGTKFTDGKTVAVTWY